MVIYVYADVVPIRYGKRNKKPTSDSALWKKNEKRRKQVVRFVP